MEENAQLLSAAASTGMLLVWLCYLQLFYLNLRREQRARLLIQPTAGKASNARCVAVNMSEASVDIVCVLLAVSTEETKAVHDLEEIATRTQDTQTNPARSRSGPVAPGHAMNLGTFDELLADAHQALRDDGISDEASLRALEVRVVFYYRTYDRPLAVCRQFYIDNDSSQTRISAETSRTHQLVSWPKRRQAERWYMHVFG